MEPLTRRGLLGVGLGSLAWLVAQRVSRASSPAAAPGPRPKSVIVLWLAGGPSQIETFDPKPKLRVGGPTRAIATSAKGVQIAAGLPQLAEQMQHLSLLRSVVGKEGDHERASITMKTGRRPEVALAHPSLGAVCAHELPEADTEIPRYVSILPSDGTSRGGFLGQAYDPFQVGDPRDPIQDIESPVGPERRAERMAGLELVEERFAAKHGYAEKRTLHRERIARATRTMNSAQLDAFRVEQESAALQSAYGDNPFGRGCLAARRLVEVGVRCIEVTLSGWDTHVNNFDEVARLNAVLDPAFATLVRDLRDRDLFDSTLVICTGEFGRTPKINPADGRDHWPTGFSLVMGGCGIAGGRLLGDTGEGSPTPKDPVTIPDVYATALSALGLDPETENQSDSGRPVKLSDGKPLTRLFA